MGIHQFGSLNKQPKIAPNTLEFIITKANGRLKFATEPIIYCPKKDRAAPEPIATIAKTIGGGKLSFFIQKEKFIQKEL